MDELIGRLAAKAGVNDAVDEKIIGTIPGFLRGEGSSDNVQALIDRMGRLRRPAHELFRFGHDKIGTDGVTGIIAPTPGLVQIA